MLRTMEPSGPVERPIGMMSVPRTSGEPDDLASVVDNRSPSMQAALLPDRYKKALDMEPTQSHNAAAAFPRLISIRKRRSRQ
jgi:hypothetical protein